MDLLSFVLSSFALLVDLLSFSFKLRRFTSGFAVFFHRAGGFAVFLVWPGGGNPFY